MCSQKNEPLICFDCGHCLTMSCADKLFSMKDVYQWDNDGRCWTDLKPLVNTTSILPLCPTCHVTMTGPKRYKRIVNWFNLANSGFKFTKGHETSCAKVLKASHLLVSDFRAMIKSLHPESNLDDIDKTTAMLMKHKSRLEKLKERQNLLSNAEHPLQRAENLVNNNECVPPIIHSGGWRLMNCRIEQSIAFCTFVTTCCEMLAGKTFYPTLEDDSKDAFAVLIQCSKQLLTLQKSGTSLANRTKSYLSGLQLSLDSLIFRLQAKNALQSIEKAISHDVEPLMRTLYVNQKDVLNKCVMLYKRLASSSPEFDTHTSLQTSRKNLEALLKVSNQETKSSTTKQETTVDFEMMLTEPESLRGAFGGHWYACENGHPYSFGERQSKTKCPECCERLSIDGQKTE